VAATASIGTHYETSSTAFAGYLIFRGCTVLGTQEKEGKQEVVFLLDLRGQDIQLLEGEYWKSEAYQVENFKKLLIRKYVRK